MHEFHIAWTFLDGAIDKQGDKMDEQGEITHFLG